MEEPVGAPALASVATPNDAVTLKPPLSHIHQPQDTHVSGSLDRDVALSQLENEKRSSFIKAWEESKKTKVDNKAQKKLSAVATWEKTQRTKLEAKLKKLEDELEHKKAEYAEKIKNEVAFIHKEADEKRALVEATRGEQLLKAEETAAKYRATGQIPKKHLLGCCGC